MSTFQNHFIVYSVNTNQKLASIPCGGGHRAWDFCFHDNQGAMFVYIKTRDVMLCQTQIQRNHAILKVSFYLFLQNWFQFCYYSIAFKYVFTFSYDKVITSFQLNKLWIRDIYYTFLFNKFLLRAAQVKCTNYPRQASSKLQINVDRVSRYGE